MHAFDGRPLRRPTRRYSPLQRSTGSDSSTRRLTLARFGCRMEMVAWHSSIRPESQDPAQLGNQIDSQSRVNMGYGVPPIAPRIVERIRHITLRTASTIARRFNGIGRASGHPANARRYFSRALRHVMKTPRRQPGRHRERTATAWKSWVLAPPCPARAAGAEPGQRSP